MTITQSTIRSNNRPPWMEKPGRVAEVLRGTAVVVILILVIYPCLSVLMTSLASEHDIVRQGGLVLFPTHPTLAAYRAIFSGGVVARSLVVSVVITVIGTVVSMAITTAMAYGLSRPGVTGGRFMLLAAVFTILFSPGIIPSYLVVKQLGLLNSYAALILPVMINAFNMVILRNFFMNIPGELIDSARIDGAGDLAILLRLILPLSKGVLAVITLFYAVNYWNAFFTALLYLDDSSKWPLSLILRLYVLQGQPLGGADQQAGQLNAPTQSIQMAVVMIALIPILCLYPFLQRYFTKGVLTGAIKG